jgi:hypothetical protein
VACVCDVGAKLEAVKQAADTTLSGC